tara:strand:+ start:374 stop:586 length:213 start_codon:yes stop_codon:yes gene_type:complete
MKKNKKRKSFESSMDRLENLVLEMESGKNNLEKSMELFEEGMELISNCQEQLKKVELRIEEYSKKKQNNN